MPERIFLVGGPLADALAVDLAEPHGLDGTPLGTQARPRTISGRWRSETGEALAGDFAVLFDPPAAVEYPDESGRFASAVLPSRLTFASQLPPDATMLGISVDGIEVGEVPVAALAAPTAPLPPPRSRRVGDSHAPFVVPVFAERFTNHARFISAVEQLHAWILQQPPFDERGLGTRLAFDAHFWSSDPVAGLFGTFDSNNPDQRLFHGERQLARRLLAPWAGTGASLILIDSQLRGGAGGQPGYSAWTSITAMPGERWEAVCLHEIGHGLGLADEYLDRARESEWPARLEPNISTDPRPSRSPWVALATVGDEPAPTAASEGMAPTGAIGTFQGARYRNDLYRSSEACLMKQTNRQFCAACCAHIRTTLARNR